MLPMMLELVLLPVLVFIELLLILLIAGGAEEAAAELAVGCG